MIPIEKKYQGIKISVTELRMDCICSKIYLKCQSISSEKGPGIIGQDFHSKEEVVVQIGSIGAIWEVIRTLLGSNNVGTFPCFGTNFWANFRGHFWWGPPTL